MEATSNQASISKTSDRDLLKIAATRLSESRKAASSKYDYIKIKVWLGEGLEHYYILSRFLISRVLTVTKVPQDKAIKIALEVKKWLVDNDQLDVTQTELESVLFNFMRTKGFGDDYVVRYKMINKFQQQKRPLIILICGSACTGKSVLAQQLASRLNLPNVLQTDALRDLLQGTHIKAPLSKNPLWMRHDVDATELISLYRRESNVVRLALDGDLVKCISDGKSIIIEGLHLDPGIYIKEFGKDGFLKRRASGEELNLGDDALMHGPDVSMMMSHAQSATDLSNGLRTYGDPIFIPIVLRVEKDQYRILADDWVSRQMSMMSTELERTATTTTPTSPLSPEEQRHRIMEHLTTLQEYVCSYASVPVMTNNLLNFHETLDALHDYVLGKIEAGVSACDVLVCWQLATMQVDHPFERTDQYGDLGMSPQPLFEQIRLFLMAIFILPLKTIGSVSCLLSYYVVIKASFVLFPPSKRADWVATLGKIHCRACLFCLGFFRIRWIKIPPKTTSNKLPPSPVALVSNHSSWLDIPIHMSRSFPSFVARDATKTTPIIGTISQAMGCLYVDRSKKNIDNGGKNGSSAGQLGVAALVKKRMEDSAAGRLPGARPMLLFPEGTTSNGQFMLPFKTGAFLAGVPLQPIVIRYHTGRFSTAWETIGISRHIFLTMCTGMHSVTCYELPVYVPSEEEKNDPKLYANNVRKLMMDFGGFKDTKLTYEDKVEYWKVIKKRNGLPLSENVDGHDEKMTRKER